MFDRCWLCGVKAINTWPPTLETHDIARGQNRDKAKSERCNLVRACQRCHQGRLDGMPVARQLAIKLLSDPDGYDLVRVNRLRNRADSAITDGEVLMEIHELDMDDKEYPFPRWIFGD